MTPNFMVWCDICFAVYRGESEVVVDRSKLEAARVLLARGDYISKMVVLHKGSNKFVLKFALSKPVKKSIEERRMNNPERKTYDRLKQEGAKDLPELPGSVPTKLKPKQPTTSNDQKPATPVVAGSTVEALIHALKMSDDPTQKRKIRMKLRKLGHRGGARS